MTTLPTTPPWPEYAGYIRRFGLAFSPEKVWQQYADHPAAFHPDGVHGRLYDATVAEAFRAASGGTDPFSVALAVWYEDGLLGANDPGPPAFRAAHTKWVDDHIDTSDIPEATESDFVRSRLTYPRPRLNLWDMLEQIQAFNFSLHPLTLLGGEKDPTVIVRTARDRLIAWFAARGVDIDAEK